MPVLRVELGGLGPLPDAGALERGVVVLGPREAALKDDLAGLPAVVFASGPVGVDYLRGVVRIGQRPDAVAQASCHPRRARTEGRHVDGRPVLPARVEIGPLGAEEPAVVVEPLAVE